MRTLIIGGVAGGATTAARLRRMNENMEIIVFERGDYISYANCGLPYYIGDVIKDREALLLQTPKAMKDKFNVDVRISSEVVAIHPQKQIIEIKNLSTGEIYEENYDNLVIATGSSPIKPPLPGIDNQRIFSLWNVKDTDAIKEYIKEKAPKRATVIGGGFIGLEMAENLHTVGMEVTLIELQSQVMAPVDMEMANLLHENMVENGVKLLLGKGVSGFTEGNNEIRVQLSTGEEIGSDLVILSLGVRPNSKLAEEAGLKLGERKGIVVDEMLQTSDPHIYAVGDVIEVTGLVDGKKTMIPLAGPANKQGRILADNLSGHFKNRERAYKGSFGTAVVKVFDLNVASVGLNEKQLISQGLEKNKDYYTLLINQKSHAGYYPGATTLTLKFLFPSAGRILGAQIVGADGVDKRIDTIATTMRLNGSIYDLKEMELSYAPPFSSAKDPVNMAGFVAENILEGLIKFIEWNEVDELLLKGLRDTVILDVREDVERLAYSIPASYHIPLGQLRKRLGELDKSKLIIPYCAVGVRSYNAARILMQNGFSNVATLSGGTGFYRSMHYEKNIDEQSDATEENMGNINAINEENIENMSLDIMANRAIKVVDCCGLQCPGPIMKVNEALKQMHDGEVLQVCATDRGFATDVSAWCRRTGNTMLKSEKLEKGYQVYIRKGTENITNYSDAIEEQAGIRAVTQELPQNKTMVVFSGDLDKVLASFIIANGATAMGRQVTMFFTFWGLNVLRKDKKAAGGLVVKKSLIEKMFGFMMPQGSSKLKLSKMNMGGMGTAMMKMVMKKKNVDSLEVLIKQARDNGVKLVACTMSMDIMGIRAEELIDGVELAGVASYLGDAEESNVNLFI